MSRAARVWALVTVVAVVGAGVLWFGMAAYARSASERSATSQVATATPGDAVVAGRRIVFRSTAPGQEYGRVASVVAADTWGPRMFAPVACDRVDATADGAVCLVTERGIVTRFTAHLLDASWATVRSWPLPGLPSRTRFSPDGRLVATTSFVTGHSYAATGFSTETVIRGVDGTEHVNVEELTLLVNGSPLAPVDRNVWGVTFADPTTFYATVQSATLGRTWLVRGDLGSRTLTAVREGAECPSLSPDGTRLAYKKVVSTGPATVWNIAVLDLASGREELLAGETRNVDDQVEWLDDGTVLYGLPRPDEPGVTDVWSLPVDDGADPVLLVPMAWSPSVVEG